MFKNNYYELGSRKTSDGNAQKEIPITDVTSVRIFRIYNETTKKQEIYYSLNNQEKIFLNDLFRMFVWVGVYFLCKNHIAFGKKEELS